MLHSTVESVRGKSQYISVHEDIMKHVEFSQKTFPNFTFKFIFNVPKSIYTMMNLHEAISKYSKFHILFMKPVNNPNFYGFSGNLTIFVT